MRAVKRLDRSENDPMRSLKKHNTESGSLSSVLRRLLWWYFVLSVSSISPFGPTRTGMAISYWPRLDKKAAVNVENKERIKISKLNEISIKIQFNQ